MAISKKSKKVSRSNSKSEIRSKHKSRSVTEKTKQSEKQNDVNDVIPITTEPKTSSRERSKSLSEISEKSTQGRKRRSRSESESFMRDEDYGNLGFDDEDYYFDDISKPKEKVVVQKLFEKKDVTIVTINDVSEFKRYMPRYPKKVVPETWELPSHKTFFNWVETNYSKYKQITKDEDTAFKQFPHQELVRDFMQDKSPSRGILLYHGLGSGKTCASIAISEASRSKKEVVFLSKAKLESNFIEDGLKKCGHDYYKLKKQWVFCKCKTPLEKKLAAEIGIPMEAINRNGGMFLVDQYKKGYNYNKLGSYQDKLDYQVNAMIHQRYKFKHLDDPGLVGKIEEYPFDNKVVIIDEVHNLINNMVSRNKSGVRIEEALMNARDCKIIFLSGTPLVNDIFEATKIYNILRGYIKTHIFRIVAGDNMINWKLVQNILKRNLYVDQMLMLKAQKTIKVTQNPKNFINNTNGSGIVFQPQRFMSSDVFVSTLHKQLEALGYQITVSTEQYTALPTTMKEFEALFYNRLANKMKNKEVIKKRIVGLTSYVASNENMPSLVARNVIQVPMSNYQLGKYKKYRNDEIQKQKKQRKASEDEKIKSSYRIVSRMYCTFAFPEEIGSPYDTKDANILDELEQNDLEEVIIQDDAQSNMKQVRQFDNNIKLRYLKQLEKNADKFLSIHNGSLDIYAPKYKAIIENLNAGEGCALVYSQFISLTGLNTFALTLNTTGEYAEFDVKRVNGEWELDEKPGDEFKKKYVIWAGVTAKEKQFIFRLVFNGQLDLLPQNCNKLKEQLKKRYGNELNLYGKIIKIFMTTKSGAEGINLHNVRQVHIMESYWQFALIEQIIGRATRANSHINLPPDKRNYEVFYYLATLSPEQNSTLLKSSLINIKSDISKFPDALGKMGQIITSDEALYIYSDRKQKIINEFFDIMKQCSFDCGINAVKNYDPVHPVVCLDYESTNRDDYTYGPSIEDTMYVADTQQEWDVQIGYIEFMYPPKNGKKFYTEINPSPGQKKYIYDENFKKGGRAKPVGELIDKNGQIYPAFYKSANITFNQKSTKRVSTKSKTKSVKQTKRKN